MKFSALSLDLPHLQIEVALSEFEKLMFVTYIHMHIPSYSLNPKQLVTFKKYEW